MRGLGLAGQEGYLLVAVMLLIAIMLIAMAVEAPRIAQQIKREKEEELVHRGKEYAIAIKKYYHKVGTYPVSLEQLESTNNMRFLRQRFKDPMTPNGEWKLIHLGEAQISIPAATGAAPGAPGSTGTLNSSPLGGAATPSPTPSGLGASSGLSGGLQTGNQPGAAGTMGTLNTSNIGTGLGGSAQGGGPIIGVASTSKNSSIKEFNGNSEYDQWLFVYDPRLEQAPGSNGIIIASPRSASSPPSGTPTGGGAPGAPGTPPVPGTPGSTPVRTPTPQGLPQ